MRRKILTGLGIAAVLTVALAAPAFAQDRCTRSGRDARHAGQPAVGRHRRGARHLHAGRLRARRDRLLPGQARRPRGVDELRHLRPRLRRLLPRRLRPDVRRLLDAARSATTRRSAAACIGSGNWVFLWKGGFALGDIGKAGGAAVAGLLPLHGRLHGHHRHDPDRGHGRAVEVEGVRRLGPVLRRHLLPAVRRVDLGRRLAAPSSATACTSASATSTSPAPASCTRSVASPRSPAPSCSGLASASSTRTARPTRCPATTSRWPCSAASSCCSAGSASTPPRRSRPPTSSSPWSRRTPRSPLPSAPSSAMFWCMYSRTGKKPDPGMMVNGMLAGLVAITAPCAFVDPWAAAVIGIDRRRARRASRAASSRTGCKIDDPVGAIAVHGVGGIFGVLCVGIFANGQYGAGWNVHRPRAAASGKGVIGILYGMRSRASASSVRRPSACSRSGP